jgi:hypothetical protein
MTAPKGSKWSPNDAHITKAVSEASWLIEQPEKYPASFALLGECKWNGGAS